MIGTFEENFNHLPGDILLSLALNENAPRINRKAAVRLMYTRGDRQAHTPTIEDLLKEVKLDLAAENDAVDVVETAIEQPLPAPEPKRKTGAGKAGVTTETLSTNG